MSHSFERCLVSTQNIPPWSRHFQKKVVMPPGILPPGILPPGILPPAILPPAILP